MGTLPPIDPSAPRIFVDTSVIVAGIASRRGASYAILLLGELGFIRLVIIPYILNEAERNFQKKLPAALPDYQRVKTQINWDIQPNPSAILFSQWEDVIPQKDIPVLAAAVSAQPHRLVTLDTKHFIDNPDVASKSGVKILTPGDLIREIRALLAEGFK